MATPTATADQGALGALLRADAQLTQAMFKAVGLAVAAQIAKAIIRMALGFDISAQVDPFLAVIDFAAYLVALLWIGVLGIVAARILMAEMIKASSTGRDLREEILKWRP
jgi:hypothetical protein